MVTTAAEIIPCVCGKGALTITIVVKTAGAVDYSEDSVTPCAACGSRDVEAARSRIPPEAQRQPPS